MSFFFKNKKTGQGLPSATRKLNSADGASNASYSSLRDGVVASSPASVNTNNSLMRRLQSPTPEPPNGQAEQNAQAHAQMVRPPTAQRQLSDLSLYPWSQQRLEFLNAQSNPFPRYGAAVNSVASRDGDVYMMGGLINGVAVRSDLWVVEAGSPSLRCYPVQATAEGPGARVGHASLLVGNAFIVFGGDTKVNENDPLDDTLYLLNTSTKHWSRALPPGPRPAGRYGHTLNIIGSKIYVFGGQVEGYFFNDLVAFDLNALQQANSRWETLVQNTNDGGPPHGQIPPARTNHSVIAYNDRLYLFGGTDGLHWFNDVWTYDPKTNSWTLQECIGFIPTPREGHAAAVVGDVMYVFGGRTDEGRDLGDLAAFRISTRRWYTFQNMGPAPSPRSGHGMTAVGDKIVILGGEPSSVPREPSELSLSYTLDTTKIRYPNDGGPNQRSMTNSRRPSTNERSTTPDRSNSSIGSYGPNGAKLSKQTSQESLASNIDTPQHGLPNGYAQNGISSQVARSGATTPTSATPQPPPLRTTNSRGGPERATSPRATTPQMDRVRSPDYASSPADRGSPAASYHARDPSSPTNNIMSAQIARARSPPLNNNYSPITSPDGRGPPNMPDLPGLPMQSVRSISQRNQRQRPSVDSNVEPVKIGTPDGMSRTTSTDAQPTMNRFGPPAEAGARPISSHRNDEAPAELQNLRSRNAWYASELALARKAGYRSTQPNGVASEEKLVDSVGDEKPLLEALLRMRTELSTIQHSLNTQTSSAAESIARIQKERDTAVAEAAYSRTRLAAYDQAGGAGQASMDGTSSNDGRSEDAIRRIASALAANNDLSARIKSLSEELETERKARHLADESSEVAHDRATELDSYKQQSSGELERLRAELHNLQRSARQEAIGAAEALATSRLLEVDKKELSSKLTIAQEQARNHDAILATLRDAITASNDKAALLERKLDHEKRQRAAINEKLAQLRSEHEARVTELETMTSRLRDAEELADSHANEAKKHRAAILAGFGQRGQSSLDDFSATDERVIALQQSLDAANSMVKRNQDAADRAAERLRRAEERIAGLEVYQEQSSREGLGFRKQLQVAAREALGMRSENADLKHQLATQKMDSTALQVQHGALRDLLAERGVDTTLAGKGDGATASTSLENQIRLREVEQQLDSSNKAHEDLKASFEQREQEANKNWEDKIAALDNDYQSAVQYLKGTERMLSKMKQELQKYKTQNKELEDELSLERSKNPKAREAPPDWNNERTSLRTQIDGLQAKVQETVAHINQQMQDLRNANAEREKAQVQASRYQQDLAQQRGDLNSVRSANAALEARATEAERKVQMLLDTVGTTVNNYRRHSQQQSLPNGIGHSRGMSINSVGGESNYGQGESVGGNNNAGNAVLSRVPETQPAGRDSMALDSLANELETLRTQWETTNKTYGTNDGDEHQRLRAGNGSLEGQRSQPTSPTMHNGTFIDWRARLGTNDGGQAQQPQGETRAGEQGQGQS